MLLLNLIKAEQIRATENQKKKIKISSEEV